jgi:hypothetical protein
MNCERYEEWLFLHRPGELNPAEAAALEAHVRDCPRCAALRNRLAADDRRLARIRAVVPEPPGADAAIERVLLAIGTGKPPAARHGVRDVLDLILLEFNRPWLRFASAFLFVAIVGGAVYQQFSIMSDVSSLEKRMALCQDQPGVVRATFVLDAETFSRIPRSREILNALGDRVAAGNDILISRDEAQSLQESMMRILPFTSGLAGRGAPDAMDIEEVSRVVRQHASLVFRLSRKEGVG